MDGLLKFVKYNLSTFVLKNLVIFLASTKLRAQHSSCQKYDKDFFQILWPSQKTQTLPEVIKNGWGKVSKFCKMFDISQSSINLRLKAMQTSGNH